ncbi:MAG: TonB-dependent receptor [Cytophagales bacterium]|nr:TonB-dependent receptor [Armatimonadota bacterium]
MIDRSITPISRNRNNGKKRRPAALALAAAPVAAMPWGRVGVAAVSAALLVGATAGVARADSTFRITVRSSADGKPILGATVALDETSGRELRQTLPTDAAGLAVSPTLSSGVYRITIRAVGFQPSSPVEVTLGDTPVPVDLQLTPLAQQVIDITKNLELIKRDDTTISTERDQKFLRRYPITEGNRQSLPRFLTTFPGFAHDALNQVHPRGEQNGTALYVNGILLPQNGAGAISQSLSPDAIQRAKVITGNFSPEFGGQSGAAVNITTRPPYDLDAPANLRRPLVEFGVSTGGFGTANDYVNIGNTVRAVGLPKGRSGFQRTLDYSLSLGQQYSDNGVEPASENGQTSNNDYSSELFFGTIGLNISPTTRIATLFNYSSGRNQVANRLAPFNGFLGRDPSYPIDQRGEGKGTRQKDNSNSLFIQLTQLLGGEKTLNLAAGVALSDVKVFEGGSRLGVVDSALPDTSWEYVSAIGQQYEQAQFQGDITIPSGFTPGGSRAHQIKLGFVYQDQQGQESYYYQARNATALAALRAISPELDAVTQTGVPLTVRRNGSYGAIYAQDTFRLSALPLVVNYGVRLENYSSGNNFRQRKVDESEFCPRINLAYTFPQSGGPRLLRFLSFLGKRPTILRLGYNQLFTQPTALGQGVIAGIEGIKPQITTQYDLSLETQIKLNQIVRLNIYSKDLKNTLDTSQLIAGTQVGPFTTLNQGDSTVNGTELVYDFNPQGNPGFGGFLVFANSTATPSSSATDNLGRPVDFYLDQDQRNTVTAGLSFALPTGVSVGGTLSYGSGVYASSLVPNGSRESITQVNLRIASGPRFANNKLGVELGVENLFDGKSRLNAASAFAGYRYQQGRRIRLGIAGKF